MGDRLVAEEGGGGGWVELCGEEVQAATRYALAARRARGDDGPLPLVLVAACRSLPIAGLFAAAGVPLALGSTGDVQEGAMVSFTHALLFSLVAGATVRSAIYAASGSGDAPFCVRGRRGKAASHPPRPHAPTRSPAPQFANDPALDAVSLFHVDSGGGSGGGGGGVALRPCPVLRVENLGAKYRHATPAVAWAERVQTRYLPCRRAPRTLHICGWRGAGTVRAILPCGLAPLMQSLFRRLTPPPSPPGHCRLPSPLHPALGRTRAPTPLRWAARCWTGTW